VAEYAPGGSATALNRWVYAGGDLVRSPMPQQIYYYPDGSGSTSYLADGTGLLLEKYTYDVGGKPTFLSPAGVVLTAGGNYTVDMLFTGQKWYVGYGILDLRARAYLAGLGRFLQPDPIGFGGDPANLYRYCANNPFNCSDPSGEGFQYTQYGNNVNFYLPVSV
jgi:RHS repeat-associated protein